MVWGLLQATASLGWHLRAQAAPGEAKEVAAKGTTFLGDVGTHRIGEGLRRGSVTFPLALFVAALPAACSSSSPWELCCSLPHPTARHSDPAPASFADSKVALLEMHKKTIAAPGTLWSRRGDATLFGFFFIFILFFIDSSSHKVWRQVQLPVPLVRLDLGV